ncbi:MAG: hypothetical protein HQM10_13145 [Candidatus Riflebacteria bacterium]|nr:hypothetical protein [Candidatus Riflebacteria bacterium]
MKKNTKFSVGASVFLMLLFSAISFAQTTPGISEDTVIRNVKVSGTDSNDSFILMKSAINEKQWFCACMNPDISKIEIDGQKVPDLILFKYQQKDAKTRKFVEGGSLCFSLDIAPSDEIIKKLKYKIPVKNPSEIILSPIPFQGLELTVTPPQKKSIVASGTMVPGIASKYALRTAKFSIPLEKLSSDLVEEALRSTTGLKYSVKYNFQVLDEPKTLRAKVDWERINKTSGFGKKKEDLSKYMQITGTTDLNVNPNFADFLKKRAREISKKTVKKSSAEKRESLKTGLYTIDLSKENPEEDESEESAFNTLNLQRRLRTGMEMFAEGFASLAGLDEKEKDRHFVVENDPAGWRYAYLSLPAVGQIAGLTIDKVLLDIRLKYKNQVYSSQTVTWTPKKGWVDKFDTPLFYAKFSLDNLLGAFPAALPESVFEIEKEIISNNDDVLKGSETMVAAAGDVPVSVPIEFADVVVIDFEILTWQKSPDDAKENPSAVSYLEVKFQEGRREFKRIIKPEIKNGSVTYPENLFWLVEKGAPGKKVEKIIPTITAVKANGSKTNWPLNGKNIRDNFPGLSVTLYDEDFQ